MEQVLKISIARGGCRFATPLYLGARYVLTFDGERANEARALLVTRPQKDMDGDLLAVAQSEEAGGAVTLALDRQALVDWFETCRATDVDETVDVHVYVFDADGVVLADSDATVEYRPIDFVVSDRGFEQWSDHERRIGALEDSDTEQNAMLANHEDEIASLHRQDKVDLETSAADASAKAAAALLDAKAYADSIKKSLAQMQYVRCEAESTEQKQVYHKVSITKNALGQPVLSVDPTPSNIEGGNPETSRYVYVDTKQEITGAKTFKGAVDLGDEASAKTQTEADESDKVATTGWVARLWKKVLLAAENVWSGKNSFTGGVSVGGGTTTDTLTVSNKTVLRGPVDVSGTLTVSNGDASVSGAASVGGDATVNGDATVAGSAAIGGDLTVEGGTTVGGAVTLNGTTTVTKMNAPSFAWDGYTNQYKTYGIGAEYFWEALRNMVFFFNGDYRNDNALSVPALGTGWSNHDRQVGYANFFATSIAANCFKDATTLYYLWLPNVTRIPDYAFYGCTNLKVGANGHRMPQVTYVGSYAFYNCDQIKAADSTSFPKLGYIGEYSFANCSSMTKVDLPLCRHVGYKSFADIGAITSFKIGYQLTPTHTDEELEKMKAAIRALHWMSRQEDTFKAELITSAWKSAGIDFNNCNPYVYDKDSLTEVVAPVADLVHNYAFYSSQKLANIDVANALYIGNYAFAQIGYDSTTAARFETLSLPKCVGIGYMAFSSTTWDHYQYNCRTVAAPELEYLGAYAFYMTNSLELFNAPKVKLVGKWAFAGCDHLGASTADDAFLRFPECTTVGQNAFMTRNSDSGKFRFVDLSACTMIGSGAFSGRSSLTELVVYAMNGNTLVSRTSSTDTTWDAPIGDWGLPTTAWSGTPESHTGVSVHCVNDAGVHIIVGYKDGKWQIVANEE